MNNLYGAIGTTITVLMLFYIYLLRSRVKNSKQDIISQSMLQHRYSNRKNNSRRLKTKSQSKIHFDKTNIKVIIFDNSAYWIKDNIFYKAPLVNQLIDKDAAEQVDTIHMDKVQLDKMLFIMDRLREGIKDDSRGSGDE
jgi:uncharacterized membrane protein YhiD involved in acid resistance